MPTITLSDASYNELKAALAVEQAPSPRPTPEPTPTLPVQPPIVPSGDWQARAHEAALRQGYSHAVIAEWDWANGGLVFDTASRGQVRERGVVVISFVARGAIDNVNAQVTAIGYPAPNQGNQLTMSLSTIPCDFTVAAPALSIGDSPTIVFCIGAAPRTWWGTATGVGLEAGQRYYLNVTGRDTYQSGVHGSGEFRIEARVPQGH